MDTSFIYHIVSSGLRTGKDSSKQVYVFPNKRAGLYFKKEWIRQIQKTAVLPEIITFDAFVEDIAELQKIADIDLLFLFYDIYLKITKNNIDSFETFSHWATTLLDDFNEISIHLVDESSLFSNIKSINEIKNWNPDTEQSTNYFAFIQHIESYYKTLNENLLHQKKAYQGLIFKQAVAQIQHFILHTDKEFIFAGFNYLNKSQSYIIQELLEAGKAKIYWNVYRYMLENQHPAGAFIRNHIDNWPYYKKHKVNWISEETLQNVSIDITSVSNAVEMQKYASEITQQYRDSEQVAWVLADQSQLPVVLNSLNPTVSDVNISMGIPLKNHPFTMLVQQLMHTHIHANNNTFYYKNILHILNHPLIQSHFSHIHLVTKELQRVNTIYWSGTALSKLFQKYLEPESYPILSKLFSSVAVNAIFAIEILRELIFYLKNKVNRIEREVLFQHFQILQQISTPFNTRGFLKTHDKSLEIFQIVYKQIINREILNFIGEPLQGLQILGFLETQAISFQRVIITAVNEGVLPRDSIKNSFIPFDVRKRFQLLTHEEESNIVAYHFYRLLSNAKEATLVYNNQSDTFGGGEKSRFITQLLWDFPDIRQQIVNPVIEVNTLLEPSINKTQGIIKKLEKMLKEGISPSALTGYIYNPVTFYQQYILGLQTLQNVEETVEANTMGSVIHDSLEDLYRPQLNRFLTIASLQKMLDEVPEKVQNAFTRIYKKGQITVGKNRLIYEVAVSFIKRFIKAEIREVTHGKQIKILALEKKMAFQIKLSKIGFPVKIKGIIDRIDQVDGVTRIIDYKTGLVKSADLNASDISLLKSNYKYSKALQVILYTQMYRQNAKSTGKMQAGIISFKNLQSGFMPVRFSKDKEGVYIHEENLSHFYPVLEELLLEIMDTNVPFSPNKKA